MGNLSLKLELFLSVVVVREDRIAAIACSVKDSFVIHLIVQDKLGRSVLDETIQVNENTHEILFQTTGLKPGAYHAWLYIEEKVFVKSFQISEENESGFFEKIFSKFR